jgi:hypothetical protein
VYFFIYLYGPQDHFSCFMLSFSISGSQMAKFIKNYICENNTFVRLVKNKVYGVKATAVSFLIGVSNCLFKSVEIFALSLIEKKLQLFLSWQIFVLVSIFFEAIVNLKKIHIKDKPQQKCLKQF